MPEEKWIDDVIDAVIVDALRPPRTFVLIEGEELRVILKRRLTEGVAAEVERLRRELTEAQEEIESLHDAAMEAAWGEDA
jgi:hypothetical protein